MRNRRLLRLTGSISGAGIRLLDVKEGRWILIKPSRRLL
jgi:hypothetical protein